jgi:hypothetical protein
MADAHFRGVVHERDYFRLDRFSCAGFSASAAGFPKAVLAG